MPKPSYIICCQGSSIDQTTNLVTAFQILEGFNVFLRQSNDGPPEVEFGNLPMQVVPFIGISTWMRDDDDNDDQEYEHEIVLRSPGKEPKSSACSTFRFTRRYQRFMTQLVVEGGWQESGDFVFESKIREVGTQEWLSQSYVIPITVDVRLGEGSAQVDRIDTESDDAS